ncbi:NLR family CARD domain-containing protein 3-like [Poeciliopsis prolifica]|uniref:NLR family CARD domain-containing protein 3-like n=1 Tax=Poeciliopsis prolifica TaxID=188132 RepID=UPI00241433E1|nr:NLR family CARD domain-containing protein 3-like [Poeciliopsis prolifica]
MYIEFLLVQLNIKEEKYDGGKKSKSIWSPENRKLIESLGKLAFDQLLEGNLIFYDKDLTQCGINIQDAALFSGVFTEMFKRERGTCDVSVYSFVHLSIQEFLAAVYMLHCFTSRKSEEIKTFLGDEYRETSLDEFMMKVMKKSLSSQNGHLDLFVSCGLHWMQQPEEKQHQCSRGRCSVSSLPFSPSLPKESVFIPASQMVVAL